MSTLLDAMLDAFDQMVGNAAERMRRESLKRQAEIAQAIEDFGPDLIESWNEDAPTFRPKFGRRIKLVYIGEFTESNWRDDMTEPERLYSGKYGSKVILYIGDDRQLYTYERCPQGHSRQVIDFQRVDLSKADYFRLGRYHEELLAVGIR